MSNDHDVLEQNVSTLLETGGEAPRITDLARTRIRAELIAKHGAVAQPTRSRKPLIAVGIGLAATAVIAVVATRLVGGEAPSGDGVIADGSTYLTEAGAKLTVLGPRHVRVEGAALLDVVPGKGPFVVETAHGRIEVLGTKFLVEADAARTIAAVVRGSVKLATEQGDVLLHVGEQGVAEPGRAPVRGPAPRLSHLASWAQQARREHDAPVHHGTLFARDPGVRSHPPWGDEYPLPIKRLGVDIVVEDQVARVALDQTFHNVANQDLEGVYRFAIPSDAALQRLAMYVDGKLEESAVVERMQGRRIYEELVYRRIDPALLEWAGTGRLSLRVFPIPALQDKRLMLAYTQSLPKLYDDWTLTVPLPEVDEPVGELDISMRVKNCAHCELTSTSHQLDVTREGDDAIVHVLRRGVKLGDSLVVHVRDPRQQTTVAMKTDGDDRYLMVRASADLAHGPTRYRPRTWVILDDVSASRDALELRAQSDLVGALLRELDENDKVAVVAFDVEARQKLAATRVLDVDRRAVREALQGEGGVGATDFSVALAAAMKMLAGTSPDDAMIVYLGDGLITSGARNLDALRAQIAGKAHFIGVGVGDGPDTQTLGGLAAATGGYATTIDLSDDLEWRAFDLVAALHTARVTGLEAKLVDAAGALVASTSYLGSSQLADGEELELVAKLASAGTPAAVELTGTLDGAPWHRTIELAAKPHDGAGYLPRLWAQRHIAARLLAKHEPVVVPPCSDHIRSNPAPCHTEAEVREARDEAIRQEIVGLGKRYFLLSRHTSLLVLENDAMYQQYGVTKGSGDTWAPYAMPAKIPVVASVAPPSNIASDAELVRTPLQVFYDQSALRDGWTGALDESAALDEGQFKFSERPTSIRGGGFDRMVSPHAHAHMSRMRAAGAKSAKYDSDLHEAARVDLVTSAQLTGGSMSGAGGRGDGFDAVFFRKGLGVDDGKEAGYLGGPMTLMRFVQPGDASYSDVTAFVPALLPDAADAWRRELAVAQGQHAIDDRARAMLGEARRRLPSGIYRWDDVELAVDDARRIGWRRTTDQGLAETASFDGTTWTRRYGELGLDVSRPVGEDDIALALGYLPVWIADPAHYARWFDVKARGPHEIVLSRQRHGNDQVAYVLRFDDAYHLVAISDGDGEKLVEVTWGATGPTAARAFGDDISVGFTGEAISDAGAWAHHGSEPGIAVELPMRMATYWQDKLGKLAIGSVEWRHAERQLMASLAITQGYQALWQAYDALQTHGGVELGDLALASSGVALMTTDAQFAAALAPWNRLQLSYVPGPSLVEYMSASREYTRSQRLDAFRIVTANRDGLLASLGTLRAIVAQLAAGKPKPAIDELVAMGDRAFGLRLIAAASTNQYNLPVDQIVRAWDSVAVGPFRNIARAQAAQALYNHGQYDAAAERIAQLVADLDLRALPARLDIAMYVLNSSRRGPAGWQIVWASWRDRVLAGTSYPHVMALLALASQHPADLPAILARAAELAGDNVPRKIAVVSSAIASGQVAWAQTVLDPLIKTAPTRELEQLAARAAIAQGRLDVALADLEAAQDAGGDEAVDINVVRAELGQIIGVARQLAAQSTGPARAHAVERALHWGDRWRAVDPGNTAIDEQLGEMMLAIGDSAGAWRQLSSTIERDPWSGAGYMTVADAFERQGRVADALELWQQAIVIDQTNPTPRLRKAQALIALGRSSEGDALLQQIAGQKWHDMWSGVVAQAKNLIARGQTAR